MLDRKTGKAAGYTQPPQRALQDSLEPDKFDSGPTKTAPIPSVSRFRSGSAARRSEPQKLPRLVSIRVGTFLLDAWKTSKESIRHSVSAPRLAFVDTYRPECHFAGKFPCARLNEYLLLHA